MLLLLFAEQGSTPPPVETTRYQFLLALTTELGGTIPVEPEQSDQAYNPGGAGRVRKRDVDRILKRMRGAKKRKPIKIIARAVWREVGALPEPQQRDVSALIEPLLTVAGKWKADAEDALTEHRALLERSYATLLAIREAEEAAEREDEDIVIEAWLMQREQTIALLSKLGFRV